jgi:hypothetical protein
MEDVLQTRYKETVKERYLISVGAEEIRIINGKPRHWTENGFCQGFLGSIDSKSPHILRNASSCDGFFFAEVSPGEIYVGSDGTKLTYISDNELVDTPSGRYEKCQLWEVRRWTDVQKIVCRTFYKEGVGIVCQDYTADGITTTHKLISYEIKGGNGLLPIFKGNTWSYDAGYSPDVIKAELNFTVSYADDNRILISDWKNVEIKFEEK